MPIKTSPCDATSDSGHLLRPKKKARTDESDTLLRVRSTDEEKTIRNSSGENKCAKNNYLLMTLKRELSNLKNICRSKIRGFFPQRELWHLPIIQNQQNKCARISRVSGKISMNENSENLRKSRHLVMLFNIILTRFFGNKGLPSPFQV